MRERLKDGFSDDYADAIDILCGEIISIDSIDSSNWNCIVTDGKARYNVVTNIAGLKKGEIVPIAKLPPQIVHGVLSEGMFAGSSKGLQRFTSEEVGKRPNLSDKELGQARGILENIYVSKK
jgi:predicted RNA-binding protein with EMAP domain